MSSRRAEWPKEQFIPPYVPRFRSGWEPPMLNFMGSSVEPDLYQLNESVANAAEHHRKQETKRLSTEVVFQHHLLKKNVYFWLHWVFNALCRLSLVVVSGGCPSVRYRGFSSRWFLLLWGTGFSS